MTLTIVSQLAPYWPGTALLSVSLAAVCYFVLIIAKNGPLSWIGNVYLSNRFAIRSSDGKRALPSCRYQFPNGQGNVLKFYNGEALAKKWRSEHGSIYRIWAGSVPEVVLTRADQIQHVFKDSNVHVKGGDMDSGWLVEQLLGDCLGLQHGERWGRLHKVFDKHFDRLTSLTYLPLVEQRLQEQLSEFEESCRLGPDRFLFNPSTSLKLLAFLSIADVLYGRLPSELENQLKNITPLREDLWHRVMKGGLSRFAISQYLPTETNRKLRQFQQDWRDFNRSAYTFAKKLNPDAPIVSFFDAVEQGELSERELLQTLDEILFANLDVTLGNFSWNPLFLAANPEIQKELHSEIMQLGADLVPGGAAAYIAKNATLLTACIQESARLKPMTAFSLSQAAPSARVIDEYVIPAGTNFIIDSQAVNVLDPCWGEDTMSYRPRRFLDTRSGTANRYRFWRFGFGPRQCLGKSFADILLKTALMRIIERYTLQLKSVKDADTDTWQREPEKWISVAMQDIICIKRQ